MFKTLVSKYANYGSGLIEYHDWFIEVVDSPDDGGFYCLIIDDAGIDVGETDVYRTRDLVIARAREVIDNEDLPQY